MFRLKDLAEKRPAGKRPNGEKTQRGKDPTGKRSAGKKPRGKDRVEKTGGESTGHHCVEVECQACRLNVKSVRLRKSLPQMLAASIVIRSESGTPITTSSLLEGGRHPSTKKDRPRGGWG